VVQPQEANDNFVIKKSKSRINNGNGQRQANKLNEVKKLNFWDLWDDELNDSRINGINQWDPIIAKVWLIYVNM